MASSASPRLSILVITWRDRSHPQGGGSEQYVERMAEGLVAQGHRVTVVCARHDRAPTRETIAGVRFYRRGNKLTVYLYALLSVLSARPDLVLDVQNGLPFLSPLVARCPVLVLVHHVHREQWHILYGRILGAFGWWIESVVAPRLYRRCRYVTVSESTRRELAVQGIDPSRVTVVPNGLDPVPHTGLEPTADPLLVVVSRLVPHKQIEHAIEAVARLRDRWPGLRLQVLGEGPWLDNLRRYAAQRGVADHVQLCGWVTEDVKHRVLAQAWLHLCPSAKEGWGMSVVEAAAHGVPTVAYAAAGGVCESVRDGVTGVLVADLDEFVAQVARLIADDGARARMAGPSRSHAAGLDWSRSQQAMMRLVCEVAGGSRATTARQSGFSLRRVGGTSPGRVSAERR